MIKVIKDFLPKTLFDYMKLLVESENDMSWNFNPTNLLPGDKTPGAENHKLGKTLYIHPSTSGDGKEIYDKELMTLFGLFPKYMMNHMQVKLMLVLKKRYNYIFKFYYVDLDFITINDSTHCC